MRPALGHRIDDSLKSEEVIFSYTRVKKRLIGPTSNLRRICGRVEQRPQPSSNGCLSFMWPNILDF